MYLEKLFIEMECTVDNAMEISLSEPLDYVLSHYLLISLSVVVWIFISY